MGRLFDRMTWAGACVGTVAAAVLVATPAAAEFEIQEVTSPAGHTFGG